jgi:hypothetical protein
MNQTQAIATLLREEKLNTVIRALEEYKHTAVLEYELGRHALHMRHLRGRMIGRCKKGGSLGRDLVDQSVVVAHITCVLKQWREIRSALYPNR